jgi:hypothetical protein
VRRAELSLWARVLGVVLRRQGRSDVAERLDAVYSRAPGDAFDRAWLDAGLDVLRRVEWED